MADKKITDLPALTVADDTDLFAVVDVSGNITKKVTRAGLIPEGSISTPQLSDGAVTASKVDAPRTAVEYTGSNQSGVVNVTTVTGDFGFTASKLYLIVASSRLSRTNGTSSVFIHMLQVDGVTIAEQRLQSDQQAGDTIISLYKPVATGTLTVRFRTERVTGTGNFLIEAPKISIVPLVFVGL